MFNLLLPKSADNTYRGHKLALWLFVPIVLLKSVIGFNSIFHGYYVASSADGIPLDTFPSAAAQAVVSLFALLGHYQLVICLLAILVLVRYRSLIPFMFVLLLLDQLSRKLILHFLPVVTAGTPPGSYITLGLLVVTVLGLALSLWSQGKPR